PITPHGLRDTRHSPSNMNSLRSFFNPEIRDLTHNLTKTQKLLACFVIIQSREGIIVSESLRGVNRPSNLDIQAHRLLRMPLQLFSRRI
ncbi:MAG TPA: hypothetical protein VK463_07895, partial [Desulfomonilaceae bacterium]|nr:hypothetical protein [Desulfomonilaceae bacterium]